MSNVLVAIVIIAGFGLICGFILGFSCMRFKVTDDLIVDKIDNILPQSQCCQCGYLGCRPYAEAIIKSSEMIDKCTPGGEEVTLKIAELLNVELKTIDNKKLITEQQVAFIDETNCIGCTKCIKACPVDAIVGTRRSVHTVITDLCTGCDLCIAPCPTNCITMRTIPGTIKIGRDISAMPIKI
ncbi:MAG: electron transport complex subunit RsxB [Candidatus Arsenophonus melophagi]|nr:electron transport complex subunit RsxB [Candidatus Arsenophonus melophagi]